MAQWCIGTGFDDQVYNRLTRAERQAFIDAVVEQKGIDE